MRDTHSEVRTVRADALRVGMDVRMKETAGRWTRLTDVWKRPDGVWIYWGASHCKRLDHVTDELETRYTHQSPAVDTGPGLTVKDFK